MSKARGIRFRFPENFWQKLDCRGNNECWPFLGSQRNGYGRVWRDGRNHEAHRIAYELMVGPIPPGLDVLHQCDNPPCCNPAHLFVGTHKENMEDMIRKGRRRVPVGEEHGMAKLTHEEVRTIKELLATTSRTGVDIGQQFGVSKYTISLIKQKRIWRHI